MVIDKIVRAFIQIKHLNHSPFVELPSFLTFCVNSEGLSRYKQWRGTTFPGGNFTFSLSPFENCALNLCLILAPNNLKNSNSTNSTLRFYVRCALILLWYKLLQFNHKAVIQCQRYAEHIILIKNLHFPQSLFTAIIRPRIWTCRPRTSNKSSIKRKGSKITRTGIETRQHSFIRHADCCRKDLQQQPYLILTLF